MLLAAHEPPAFVEHPGQGSPFLITVDHASRRIPEALGDLGVPASELVRHIAWDIGASDLGVQLADRLGAYLIRQNYSRLVIDCNRPLTSEGLIVTRSEDTDIPGNRDLSEADRAARLDEIFWPYHRAIEAELARRAAAGEPTVLVALHSFTPVFRAVGRPWHGGVLHGPDTRLAAPVLELLRAEGLVIGDNEPYSVSEQSDYGAIVYGERRGNLYVELEIRQDLIEHPSGQAEWAERLSRVLPRALELARERHDASASPETVEEEARKVHERETAL